MNKPITGDEIRALREKFGITQRRVAQLLHTSEQTVRNWENGRATMNHAYMELLLIKLNGE